MSRRTATLAAALVASASLAALGGCARRAVPYHFRAPLVGSVGGAAAPDGIAELPPTATARSRPGRRPLAPPITPAAVALAAAPPRSFPLARPRLAVPAAADDLAGRLREQVGRRRTDDSLAFALAMIAHRAGPAGLPAPLATLSTPSELAALAAERGAELGGRAATAGDLLVFGPTDTPSDLLAVVVESRGDTIEFVTLAGGVVRRGWVTPSRPSAQRDDNGRILNTFVRSLRAGDRRGQKYLAGELLAARVSLARLLGEADRLAGR